jgi:hypothetical protein
LYASANIIRGDGLKHVACMGEMRNMFVERPEGKRLLGFTWGDIRMDYREIGL